MSPVDWIDTGAVIYLAALAILSKRRDFTLVFLLLLGSLIWGRSAIALTSPLASVLLCAVYSAVASALVAWRGNGIAAKLIGALFACQIIAAGFCVIGVLSPETSNGPAMNFWTWFTVASLFQDMVLAWAYYLAGDLWRTRQNLA